MSGHGFEKCSASKAEDCLFQESRVFLCLSSTLASLQYISRLVTPVTTIPSLQPRSMKLTLSSCGRAGRAQVAMKKPCPPDITIPNPSFSSIPVFPSILSDCYPWPTSCNRQTIRSRNKSSRFVFRGSWICGICLLVRLGRGPITLITGG